MKKRFLNLNVLSTCAVLFVFWMFLSGVFDFIHLAVGFAASLAAACLFSLHFPPLMKLDTILHIPSYAYRLISYSLWLLSRIVLAAIHVSKVILSPKLNINPYILKHRTSLPGENAQVIFANSITLTPGTITADLVNGEYTIHAIDKESAGDIDTGLMEDKISSLILNRRKS